MTIDLHDHVQRSNLVLRIEEDVEAFCKEHFAEPPRKHFGASQVGGECLAEMWLNFRWTKIEENAGHMCRLLNRGHLEEARFVQWLEGIGFEVREIDPETGKQYRIKGVKGHFGGSLDSLLKPPSRYNLPEDLCVWLGEFKTYNEKSFTKLAGVKPPWNEFKKGGALARRKGGDGMRKTKPQHYIQMCSYGRAYGFKFGLYLAVNKNTDELYFEIVELDWSLADDGFRKAETVINSQTIPQRISMTPTYSYCKNLCDYVGICHMGETPAINCRSCKHAIPVENGEWFCELHSEQQGSNIPDEVITTGCPSYSRII